MKTQTLNTHVRDKAHRRHFYLASAVCTLELGLILGVHMIMLHLVLTVAVFSHDAIKALFGRD